LLKEPLPLSDHALRSAAHNPCSAEVGIGWRHPHYRELLQRSPALDFLEVHSENFFAQGGATLAVLERGRANYPISLHGVGLSLGSASGVDDWHLDQLARLVKRIEPVRVSDHACFARGQFAGQPVHVSDLLPIPFSREALDVLCANVQRVQDRLQRSILIENLSAYVAFVPAPAFFDVAAADLATSESEGLTETDFLTTLCRRTGCTLLVDVNNIYVNALNVSNGLLGPVANPALDPVKQCLRWLDEIPASCVGELHLAGHCHVSDPHDEHGDIVIDDHGSRVSEAVWRIYRHAVHSFGAVPTLIEWDTNLPALDVLLDEARLARTAADCIFGGTSMSYFL
jgi:uncharacterized protein (UPF0276 family)